MKIRFHWVARIVALAVILGASAAYADGVFVGPPPVWTSNAVYQRLYANPVTTKVGVGTTTPETRLHVMGGTEVTNANGTGFVTIGSDYERRSLVLDWQGAQTFVLLNGPQGYYRTYGVLDLQPLGGVTRVGDNLEVGDSVSVLNGLTVGDDIESGGKLISFAGIETSGPTLLSQGLTVYSRTTLMGSDASYADNSGGLIIGGVSGDNVVYDSNEIMARSNGAASTLHMQAEGGAVWLHSQRPSSEWFRISSDGHVVMGDSNSLYGSARLVVDGTVVATSIRVTEDGWPDYVFEDGYTPTSIDEMRTHIEQERHLPGVASAAQVEREGVDLGEMQKQMLRHMEELTLHVIAQNDRIRSLEHALARGCTTERTTAAER